MTGRARIGINRGREVAPRLLFLALLSSAGCELPPDEVEPSLRVWEVFEAPLDVPIEGANPFDPAQLSVMVEFESPFGVTSSVPAFATQEFARELDGVVERLTATSEIGFRVRFTPTEAGTWRWRFTVERSGERVTSDWTELEVIEPASGHGFLRVGEESGTSLSFDDGTPYFAIGENLAWYDGRGTFAYDAWLEAIASNGGNYARLWMPSWAFGLEWIVRHEDGDVVESSLGDYTTRLDRAWQLDYVLRRAEELGIRVVLCIQNHGAFSLESNSEWSDNPYSAANGGPLDEPGAFFTDEEARELFRRRLRYVVARWGYSPAILAFELWNEVDLTASPSPEAISTWHDEMAGELRELDPNDHLVTTSVSGAQPVLDQITGSPLYDALWGLPGIDLVQLHYYSGGSAGFLEFLPDMVERLRSYGKPILVAEAGVDYRGAEQTLEADPESVVFHDLLWQGLFLGTSGTGMSWWWDLVTEPEDLYSHFAPVAALVEGVDFDAERFERGTASAASPTGAVQASALVGEATALVWLKNANHRCAAPDHSIVENATLTIDGLRPGTWAAAWIDAYTAELVSELTVLADEPAVELLVPPFSRDIALRLDLEP